MQTRQPRRYRAQDRQERQRKRGQRGESGAPEDGHWVRAISDFAEKTAELIHYLYQH